MFKNVKKLTNVCKLNIKEIAFIDGVYYIKTKLDELYQCDEIMIKKLAFIDTTGICNKALKQLKNNQIINKEQVIIEIKTNTKTDKKSIFDDYTFKEMYRYIINAKNKYAYLYHILKQKFDTEYDTEEKQSEFFNRLSLKEHSEFASGYNSKECFIHRIQEEIWIKKSKDNDIRSKVLANADEIMYKTNKYYSNIYAKLSYKKGLLSDELYNLEVEINSLMQLIYSCNLYYPFDNEDGVLEFLMYHSYKFKYLPIILRVSYEEMRGMIDKVNQLTDEYNQIVDKYNNEEVLK